jgi:hypothetical protein
MKLEITSNTFTIQMKDTKMITFTITTAIMVMAITWLVLLGSGK